MPPKYLKRAASASTSNNADTVSVVANILGDIELGGEDTVRRLTRELDAFNDI
jgi:hypothetical protein